MCLLHYYSHGGMVIASSYIAYKIQSGIEKSKYMCLPNQLDYVLTNIMPKSVADGIMLGIAWPATIVTFGCIVIRRARAAAS